MTYDLFLKLNLIMNLNLEVKCAFLPKLYFLPLYL